MVRLGHRDSYRRVSFSLGYCAGPFRHFVCARLDDMHVHSSSLVAIDSAIDNYRSVLDLFPKQKHERRVDTWAACLRPDLICDNLPILTPRV